MKNKKIKIGLFFSLVLILIILLSVALIGKKGIGLIIDKVNLSKDTYDIQIDKDIRNDVFIYWFGETVDKGEKNRMLIYHKTFQAKIPSSYGANWIEIRYKDIIYNKIGIWKIYAYSKYNYCIDVSKDNNNLLVQWKIVSWYDSKDSSIGKDTIKIGLYE